MKAIIGVLVGLALIVGAYVAGNHQSSALGAAAGPDVSFKTYFHGNMEIGGGVLATTSQGAVTYTAAQIMNNRYIEHVASGALTATLPTAASLNASGFLKNPGDTYTLYIFASTTKITLAGNTGVNLETASSTKDISANGVARIDFMRQSSAENRNIEAFLSTAQ